MEKQSRGSSLRLNEEDHEGTLYLLKIRLLEIEPEKYLADGAA